MPIDRSVGVFTAYGFDAVQQVLKDGETFSSAGYADIMGQVLGHSILEMDEPEHHLYRGLVQQAFSRKAMETWERELVRDVVDEQHRRVHRPHRRAADLVRERDVPVPGRRDRPAARPRPAKTCRCSTGTRSTVISAGFEFERAVAASQALYEYFCGDHRRAPQASVRRRDLGARAGRARRRAPRRRGDLLVPAAAAARRRGDDVPLVVEPVATACCRTPTSSTRCATTAA